MLDPVAELYASIRLEATIQMLVSSTSGGKRMDRGGHYLEITVMAAPRYKKSRRSEIAGPGIQLLYVSQGRFRIIACCYPSCLRRDESGRFQNSTTIIH